MARCDVVIRLLDQPTTDVMVGRGTITINGEEVYTAPDGMKIESARDDAVRLTLTLLPTSLQVLGPEG